MKNTVKEYFFINLGLLLVAIGIYFFLYPNNLAVGGVSGLSIVIHSLLPAIPVGVLMLAMNLILFIIGFILLGAGFGLKTVYASVVLSGLVWLMENIFPLAEPLSDDILIQLIYGVAIMAVGHALVFYQEASTGGTDIVAKIINKYYKVDIGKSLLMTDFFIVIAATAVFGIQLGMYALLGIFANGLVIDYVIQGFNMSKQVSIISNNSQPIKDYIMHQLGRGATIYEAKGAFTGKKKEVITTVLSRREFISLRNYIKSIDAGAFITVSNTHETIGEGFNPLD